MKHKFSTGEEVYIKAKIDRIYGDNFLLSTPPNCGTLWFLEQDLIKIKKGENKMKAPAKKKSASKKKK